MADLPNEPETRREIYLNAIATGNPSDLPEPVTREEIYLAYIAENGGGGGGSGTTNYNSLSNKPSINNVELVSNKTLKQLGINNYKITVINETLNIGED